MLNLLKSAYTFFTGISVSIKNYIHHGKISHIRRLEVVINFFRNALMPSLHNWLDLNTK